MRPAPVSVVLPTRDRPRALASAIASIDETRPPPSEVIVVDDGSDPPAAVPARPDRRFRLEVLRVGGLGAGGARNRGIAAASHPFIAFLDDDDVFLPGRFVTITELLGTGSPVDLLLEPSVPRPGAVRGQGDADAHHVLTPVERLRERQPPHLDGVTVSRALARTEPFDEDLPAGEDLDVLWRYAASGAVTWTAPTPVAALGPAHEVAAEPSSISLEARLAGRSVLWEKHDVARWSARHRAFYLARWSVQARRAGHAGLALRLALRGLAARPTALGVRTVARAGALVVRHAVATRTGRR